MKLCGMVLLFVVAAETAYGAGEAKGGRSAPISLELTGVLALLLGALVLSLKLKRSFVGRRRSGGAADRVMEIEETLVLGPRRSIHLLRIAGQRRVVASYENGMADLGAVPDRSSVPVRFPAALDALDRSPREQPVVSTSESST